jgi:hypothetical protein
MAKQLHVMSLRQTSAGCEITAVQPGMPFLEYTLTVVKGHRHQDLGERRHPKVNYKTGQHRTPFTILAGWNTMHC